MWAVFKINIKELNLFKEDIIKKLNSDVTFYAPKVIFKVLGIQKLKMQILTGGIKISLKRNRFLFNPQ